MVNVLDATAVEKSVKLQVAILTNLVKELPYWFEMHFNELWHMANHDVDLCSEGESKCKAGFPRSDHRFFVTDINHVIKMSWHCIMKKLQNSDDKFVDYGRFSGNIFYIHCL